MEKNKFQRNTFLISIFYLVTVSGETGEKKEDFLPFFWHQKTKLAYGLLS